ncbi:GNAT family N-acetyltransferase [Methanoculleus sp. UBA208]|uniref:GNAT family N-acetyltransferase n=1 Tax=Methanoculleus sp. UBA208 TaxID=1915494 RepID=UPI0026010D1E|nr:GNAT family N-acetyltransferase [Methanoculleus sp. UBA208]
MTYSIEPLSESNACRWEEFVNRSREGTPFHGVRWKNALEDVLKLKVRYYLILDDRKVIGICPFVEQSMKRFRGLNGIPRSEYNNIILDETFDADHINDILSLFSKRYSFLYFNTYDPGLPDKIGYHTVPNEDGSNVILDLNRNPPETIWKEILSKDERYKVTRFEKGGFTVQEMEQGHGIEQFYRYYSDNLNRINGYVLPFTFFQRLLDAFSQNEVRIALLTRNGVFAGGNLAILDPARKTAYFQYLALNRDLPNKYSPTYYLSWEGINWAWENGYERISLGRERPDNPRVRSKRKFGAEPLPIHSRVVLLSKTASLLYQLKKSISGSEQATVPTAGRVS